jgi:anti-sigma factor RsiW
MTKTPCKEFADRIVDYVDGELAQDEVQAVARHLAQCESCRRTAAALRRSLGLACVLWEDNLAVRSDAVRRSRSMGVPPMSSTAVPAVSPAGILPVATPDPHGRDAHVGHGQDAHATHGQDARATTCRREHATEPPRRRTLYALAVAASVLFAVALLVRPVLRQSPRNQVVAAEQIEREVARAGTAAELLAATRLVAQCEGTESIVQQQYRYILREYADTPAAASIKANPNLKLGGTHHD